MGRSDVGHLRFCTVFDPPVNQRNQYLELGRQRAFLALLDLATSLRKTEAAIAHPHEHGGACSAPLKQGSPSHHSTRGPRQAVAPVGFI